MIITRVKVSMCLWSRRSRRSIVLVLEVESIVELHEAYAFIFQLNNRVAAKSKLEKELKISKKEERVIKKKRI